MLQSWEEFELQMPISIEAPVVNKSLHAVMHATPALAWPSNPAGTKGKALGSRAERLATNMGPWLPFMPRIALRSGTMYECMCSSGAMLHVKFRGHACGAVQLQTKDTLTLPQRDPASPPAR